MQMMIERAKHKTTADGKNKKQTKNKKRVKSSRLRKPNE